MTIAKRLIASTLMLSCTLMSMPVHAVIVPTEALVETEAAAVGLSGQRARIDAFFAREDVRLALVQQGVDPQAALARVAAMSDAEAGQLAGRIEQAPAGGEVLGILFTLFIVLLVTDILGFTKVFPFTRSIR